MEDGPFVIVRAFRGQPLRRVVQTASKKAVFVRNPASGDGGSVGFPSGDVFVFEPALFDALEQSFTVHGTVPAYLWAKAVPFEAGGLSRPPPLRT